MSLAENLYFDKSASIAFDWSNVNGLSPNPYIQAERANTQGIKPYVSALFSISEVFAVAKVKLCNTQ